jgi:hypothetical protein
MSDKLKETYRAEFLNLALECGARLTGKPDGSEPIEVQFPIPAWRAFDKATAHLDPSQVCEDVAAKSNNSLFRSGAKVCAAEIRKEASEAAQEPFLPELPKPAFMCSTAVPEDTPAFTEIQMREYAGKYAKAWRGIMTSADEAEKRLAAQPAPARDAQLRLVAIINSATSLGERAAYGLADSILSALQSQPAPEAGKTFDQWADDTKFLCDPPFRAMRQAFREVWAEALKHGGDNAK